MSTHLVDDYATVQSELRKADSEKRIADLSSIIRLAHVSGNEQSQEAAIRLWEFLNKLNDDELNELIQEPSVAGPLAHLLAKLMESRNHNVLIYTARTLKSLFRDTASRESLCKAGLARSISSCLTTIQTDPNHEGNSSAVLEIRKELYAATQSILYDQRCAPELASSGGLRAIGDSLIQCFLLDDLEFSAMGSDMRNRNSDSELKLLLLVCACNAFSYCDTSLSMFIHEMRNWVEPICQALLRSRVPDSEIGFYYAACCLANATRDPGLTHALRAANGAEALDRCRHREPRTAKVAHIAAGRLQIASGLRNDLDLVWRFRWGGGKDASKMQPNEVFGLFAFLLLVTIIAGIIILLILHFSHF